jgi:hypothetical protein
VTNEERERERSCHILSQNTISVFALTDSGKVQETSIRIDQDSQCGRRDSNQVPPEVLQAVNFLDDDDDDGDDLLVDLDLRNRSLEPNVRNWHCVRNKMCCVWYRCDTTKARVYWIPRLSAHSAGMVLQHVSAEACLVLERQGWL